MGTFKSKHVGKATQDKSSQQDRSVKVPGKQTSPYPGKNSGATPKEKQQLLQKRKPPD